MSLSASTIRVAAEVTLVLVLFGDAARIRIHSLRQDVGLPVRLLGIGLPLTLVLGTFVAVALFGSFGIWMAVLTAACLAPTDAGLGQGIVTDPTVPSRVRRVENVESGLNDGIVAPLVSLAVAVLAGEETHGSDAVLHAIREIGLGVVIGVGGGLLLGWILALAVTHGWTEERAAALATTAGSLRSPRRCLATHRDRCDATSLPCDGGRAGLARAWPTPSRPEPHRLRTTSLPPIWGWASLMWLRSDGRWSDRTSGAPRGSRGIDTDGTVCN